MCGIAGIHTTSPSGDEEARVRAMCRTLVHRGPDGEALFEDAEVVLGFRRLAIIDPSPLSDQPMSSADGRHVLVFNGAIYNYVELRAELERLGHRFRSRGDTEVLLAAYGQWGAACLDRLNGMWAFAVWDRRERSLFCARDRFGVKPFYYRFDGRTFAFASEIKALLAASAGPCVPDEAVVRGYLAFEAIEHGSASFFEGISRLRPGECLELRDERLRRRTWWELTPEEDPGATPQERRERFRELFFDSVRLRLRSDVRVGTCLSGGLDSSAIVSTVAALQQREPESTAPLGDRQHTFSLTYPGSEVDERRYQDVVVARTGVAAHHVTAGEEEVLASLDAVMRAQDEPFGSTSIVGQWHVMRLARSHGVTVLLDGQGGDEILAGYHGYFSFRFADLLRAGKLRALATEVRAYRDVHGAGVRAVAEQLLRPFVPASLRVRSSRYATAQLASPGPRPALPPSPDGGFRDRLRRQLLYVLAARGLPSLLRYEDRNSMAFSIEARVPFLDYRLVRFAFSLPPDDLISRGITKVILRQALVDVLPEEVARRTDKIGFATPEREWLGGKLGRVAREVIASRSFAERGYVDQGRALAHLDRVAAGKAPFDFRIWRWLNLELWLRAHVDRAPSPLAG